ncbi:MAG: DUF4136 domain-containing protein [Halioglobus sp.]
MQRQARSTMIGILSILVTLMVTTGCSSGPPKPTVDFNSEYDFAQVKTFSLYKQSGMVSGDNPLQLSDMQRNRADDALKLALENKGITYVADPSKADILLSWHLSTQNKTDVRTYQSASYGGHYGGYNRYSRYNCWSCAPSHTEVSVKDYTEGTFIVDMIDPEVNQSVWRGVTQSRLKGQKEEDSTKYNEAAASIFETFPPY